MAKRQLLGLGLLACVVGCASWQGAEPAKYFASYANKENSHAVAVERYEKALKCLDKCELDAAEKLLKESLASDPDLALAHNALGLIYFEQRKFYPAAWEFDHAARLLPNHAEPVNNLGLVFEEVGRLDQAIAQYEIAASIDVENAVYVGNLVRARVRRGDSTAELFDLLQRLVDIDNRPGWVAWAKGQLNTGRISRLGNPQINPIVETTAEKSDDGNWMNLNDEVLKTEEIPVPFDGPMNLPGIGDEKN